MKKILSLMALCLLLGAHSDSAHAVYPNDLWKFLSSERQSKDIADPCTYAARAILWAATFKKKPLKFNIAFNKPAIEAEQNANLLKILSAIYTNIDCLTAARSSVNAVALLENALQQEQISLTKDGDVYTVTDPDGNSATFTLTLQKGENSHAESYQRLLANFWFYPPAEKNLEQAEAMIAFILNETNNFEKELNKAKAYAFHALILMKQNK